MDYKIGDVSKILGIPIGTLQYYESKGIVTPRRDLENGYRYYNDWNIYELVRYQVYKMNSYSLKESLTTEENSSWENYLTTLEEKRKIYQKKKIFYSLLHERTLRYLDIMQVARQEKFSYEIVEFNEKMHYLLLDTLTDKLTEKLFGNEKELFAFVKYIIHFNLTDKKINNFKWGLALDNTIVDLMGVSVSNEVSVSAFEMCLRTYIFIENDNEYPLDFLSELFSYIDKQGYRHTNEIFGNYMLHIHNELENKRLIEILIPIYKKS